MLDKSETINIVNGPPDSYLVINSIRRRRQSDQPFMDGRSDLDRKKIDMSNVPLVPN